MLVRSWDSLLALGDQLVNPVHVLLGHLQHTLLRLVFVAFVVTLNQIDVSGLVVRVID